MSFKSMVVFLQLLVYTTFFRERSQSSQREVFISLLLYSPIHLFSTPFCSSGDRSWQLFVRLSFSACVCVFVCPSRCALQYGPPPKCHWSQSIPPDYPNPPYSYLCPTPPAPLPLHLPPLCCSPSATFISPFTSPIPSCTPLNPRIHNITPYDMQD